ncbi:DUF1353 domain-containing protein [Gimesia fumaroli]|uniref:DUF1353 domain-containing protein n=1 Tax=Gimesia fumaroli TaxID=2527976 RepID=A0A518IC28_9PLAN|nr:DUF1353 domain-containing protein [Gimesia fumaroli]QDV50652.1 hypothetical protein Enr17x_26940 [Gimesia fumaroli]
MAETDQTVTLVSGPLQTERLADGSRRLLRHLVVNVHGKEIMVPSNYITDSRSLPGLSQLLTDCSRVDLAGVIHDRLYETSQFTRCETDTIWRLVARSGSSRANWLQAWWGWFLIRLGARFAWDRERKKNRLS